MPKVREIAKDEYMQVFTVAFPTANLLHILVQSSGVGTQLTSHTPPTYYAT